MATTTNHSIASAEIFNGCSTKEKARLESVSSSVQVKKGVTLTTQGRVGREFGVIVDGEASVTIDGEVVGQLTAGDHYGEMALLTNIGANGSHRSATVVAETDLWVSVMTPREFATVAEEFPNVMAAVERKAAERAAANTTRR